MNNPNGKDYETGTPKTLEEALENAQQEIDGVGVDIDRDDIRVKHIRDFLAQKAFDRDPVKADHFIEYFHKIFPEKKSQAYEMMNIVMKDIK